MFSKKIKHVISTSDNYIHEVDRNQKLVEAITDSVAAKPRLYPSKEDYNVVIKYKDKKYLCIAPASVWFTKQYPAEKWIDLIKKFPDDVNIYLLGAAADAELCEMIRLKSKKLNVANLAGKLSFLQSAALQQSAVMNYVNDSAPMHFASSVNAPVTAIYCSTVPSFGFGPLSDKSFIVQTTLALACKPCGLHGFNKCPLGHFKCAFTVEDHQLLEVL